MTTQWQLIQERDYFRRIHTVPFDASIRRPTLALAMAFMVRSLRYKSCEPAHSMKDSFIIRLQAICL